jgi:hypothetical protein
VSVLNEIEMLPPGLYAMHITEAPAIDGVPQYEVDFEERRLEDVAAHLNRFARADEQPFEAVTAISDFTQRAYELFAQPMVESLSNELSARLLRQFHPLRVQNWSVSRLNPALAWLEPAAKWVAEHRQPLPADHPLRRAEAARAELISAALDLYRAARDATTEARVFSAYANMYSLYLAEKHESAMRAAEVAAEPRELPFVKDALASIAEGGYDEAFARVAFLLTREGATVPLSRLVMRKELAETYAGYLPEMPLDQWRRVRGEQEIIARYEPEQAISTLPALLDDPAVRERLLTLLDKLMADERVQTAQPTPEQLAMLERIRGVLRGAPARAPLPRGGRPIAASLHAKGV